MDSIITTRQEIHRNHAAMDMLLSSDSSGEKSKNKAVFWVFRDYDNQWCVRKEGGDAEMTFTSRGDALAFARKLGVVSGAYFLFFQLLDGRMSRELFNTGDK